MRRPALRRPIAASFLIACAAQLLLATIAAACTGGADWPWLR